MNVFTDFHHASLLQSFILLFEDRLKGNVYRPIGMEWAKLGYWHVYEHPATQAQFLGIGSATPDGTRPLNQLIGNAGPNDFVYNCYDIDSGKTNKAITYGGFMLSQIDVVIASIPAHVEPFKRLCAEHPNRPKLIYQIGNSWTIEAASAPNIMASAKIDNVPPHINFIEYHQEFDLNIFKNDLLDMPFTNIYSFVNIFNGQEHLKADYDQFLQIERMMPNWSFKSFGGQCRDGAVGPSTSLAAKMKEARFIWHTKKGGDGYGHILHNAAAVGRPLIVKKEYYHGQLGEALIRDGETAICIDGLSSQEVMQKIEFYSIPERYGAMCTATYNNFRQVCDFDREFTEKIIPFLANLQ